MGTFIVEYWPEILISGVFLILVAGFSWLWRKWKELTSRLRQVEKDMSSSESQWQVLREQYDPERWKEEIERIQEHVKFLVESTGVKADLVAWGRLQFIEGNLDEAITTLSKALESDPNNDTARYYRGLSYSRKGRRFLDKTVADLKGAVTAKPSEPKRRLALAEAFLTGNRPELAEPEAQQALALGIADRARAWVVVGRARLGKGDIEGAIIAYGECPALSTPAITGIGRALMTRAFQESPEQARRTYEEVITHYTSAILDNPTASDYFTYQAEAFALRGDPGDWERALHDWEEAERLSPRDSKIPQYKADRIYQRAMAQLSGSHRDMMLREAIRQYDQAIRLAAPAYKPAIRNRLALAYQSLGNYEAAINETTRSVVENPDYTQNYMALATALLAAGRWGEAADTASRGLEKAQEYAGRIWLLFFKVVARLMNRESLDECKSDCQSLIEELKIVPFFDHRRWNWSEGEARIVSALAEVQPDITSVIQDLLAMVKNQLGISQFKERWLAS